MEVLEQTKRFFVSAQRSGSRTVSVKETLKGQVQTWFRGEKKRDFITTYNQFRSSPEEAPERRWYSGHWLQRLTPRAPSAEWGDASKDNYNRGRQNRYSPLLAGVLQPLSQTLTLTAVMEEVEVMVTSTLVLMFMVWNVLLTKMMELRGSSLTEQRLLLELSSVCSYDSGNCCFSTRDRP